MTSGEGYSIYSVTWIAFPGGHRPRLTFQNDGRKVDQSPTTSNGPDRDGPDTNAEKNRAFWAEPCGTRIADRHGAIDHSPASLSRFDRWFFGYYPYLENYIPFPKLEGKQVVEVGLGFGSVGQRIAASGANYTGVDISDGPVDLMRRRLAQSGLAGRTICEDFTRTSLPSESCDYVVAIGCFHHTGNFQACVDQTFRILRPNGEAIIMVYNRYSYRQFLFWPLSTLTQWWHGQSDKGDKTKRASYDRDSRDRVAPITEFFSEAEVREGHKLFSKVEVSKENFALPAALSHWLTFRRALLPMARLTRLGVDLYIKARK